MIASWTSSTSALLSWIHICCNYYYPLPALVSEVFLVRCCWTRKWTLRFSNIFVDRVLHASACERDLELSWSSYRPAGGRRPIISLFSPWVALWRFDCPQIKLSLHHLACKCPKYFWTMGRPPDGTAVWDVLGISLPEHFVLLGGFKHEQDCKWSSFGDVSEVRERRIFFGQLKKRI